MNNLILIGFKGAGKTTLGRKVAERLERPFVDTDRLFDAPPAVLYTKIGEAAFRAVEKQLLQSLKGVAGCVIATGGGAVLDPESGLFIRDLGTVVHLSTPREVIEKRIGSAHFLMKEYERRLGIYNQIAHHSICTEEQLWEVMRLDPFSASPHGVNLTALPSGSSSMDVLQDSNFPSTT